MSKKHDELEYAAQIPQRVDTIAHSVNKDGIVTLKKENRGFFNRLAQKLFGRPRYSYIHLDEHGSFVWLAIDGEKSIGDIAQKLHERFGEAAEPLHERLSKYICILEDCGFVYRKN